MALTRGQGTSTTRTNQDYASTWVELRAILQGQSKEVCQTYVAGMFRKASIRRTIRTHHFPVMDYVCDVGASAFALPLRVGAVEKPTRDVVVGWRPMLDQAWRARLGGGLSLLHLRSGDDNDWIVEQVWPDQVEATPNPRYPGRWDKAISVSIATPDGGKLAYERQADGTYIMSDLPKEGEGRTLGVVPVLPIFAFSRRPLASLLPPPDTTILDLHISTALQLSQTEFRQRFRTAQMYRKSEMVLENQNKGGSDIDGNPDAVLELGKDDSVGLVESTLRASDDLSYIVDCLRFATRMLGLPSEMWEGAGSRNETGAAWEGQYRPLTALQEKDRAAADEAVNGLLQAWLPPIRPGLCRDQDPHVLPQGAAPGRPCAIRRRCCGGNRLGLDHTHLGDCPAGRDRH